VVTCDEVMELMQRDLDGDLNHEEHRLMSDHLEACPECADMMERLQQIDQDLANLPKVTPAFSLVDSILPRLELLDVSAASGGLTEERQRPDAAASEMHLVSSALPQGELGRSARPWYRRGKYARIGGLTAAAVMLGILIVNGLPKSLEDTANRASRESAASGPAEMSLMAETSEADSGVMDIAAGKEAPKADRVSDQQTGIASPKSNPVSNENTAERSDNGRLNATESSGSGHEPIGKDGGASNKAAPNAEAPPEGPDKSGAFYGITGGPAATAHDSEGDGNDEYRIMISVFEEPAIVASLASEAGDLIAHVQRMPEDDVTTVVVRDRAGDTVFASNQLWEAEARVRLVAWEDGVLTYTVSMETGVQTFTIDAEATSETDVK
jgi:anti-sigma factor RsiW